MLIVKIVIIPFIINFSACIHHTFYSFLLLQEGTIIKKIIRVILITQVWGHGLWIVINNVHIYILEEIVKLFDRSTRFL